MVDVIIVGGGVIGASIAYHLSEQTNKRVLLLERDKIGSHASSAAAGMLGAQSECTPDHPLFPFSQASLEWFREHAASLEEKSGISLHLNQTGTIQLALSEEEWDSLQRRAETWHEIKTEVLKYWQLKSLVPSLSENVWGGLWVPDGQLEASNLTPALIQAARYQGVEIREQTPVRSLLIQDRMVRGVLTDQGPIEAEWVVVAGGAWSNEFLPSPFQVPLIPVKGEAMFVRFDRPVLKHTLFTKNAYLVPKQENRILLGATEHPGSMNEDVSVWGMSQLLNRAMDLFPFLEEARFEKAWAGMRPQTPDQLPILGMDPRAEGLVYAVGHYRNGILLSAITGMCLAELIGEGQSSMDITPFTPERWR